VTGEGPLQDEIVALLRARRGHFLLESGHHGDLWLELDPLFLRPARLERFAAELGRRLAEHGIEAVCGPLTGGAFLAQMVAARLDLAFTWTERAGSGYRIPDALRGELSGREVAIVDDVINAGSATRATLDQLRACGARTVAVGALLTLGTAAAELAEREGLALETLATLPNTLWPPGECPMCAAGRPPLTRPKRGARGVERPEP
jgi:orotate phosphoribosyltransferase